MEPVTLIIGAIAAGAAAAAKDTASQAVKDAYSGLKSLVQKRFSGKKNAEGEMALKNYVTKPDIWKEPLKDALIETDADKSQDIIAAVEKLQKALEDIEAAEGRATVKFKVDVKGGQVGVIGDHAKIEGGLHFSEKKS